MAAVTLSKTAEIKLASLYQQGIDRWGSQQAVSYFLSLNDCFDLLADQPFPGRQFHEYRRHEHGSHVIFYKAEPGGIVIIDIFHRLEDADKLLD